MSSLIKLSKDELSLIANKLDLPGLLNFCTSDRRVYEKIYNNDIIWIYKLEEFAGYEKKIKFQGKKYREIYISLYQLAILKQKLNLKEDIYDIHKLKIISLAGVLKN